MSPVAHEADAASVSVGVSRTAQLPLLVFALVEAVALVFWLVLGRVQWFYLDEWDFLAGRTTGDLGDLFRPHNEHWSTLPILAYRALWWAFGLRSYLPYLTLTVMAHLTAAALLWVVMRRACISPWVATAAASLFALFGAGYENVVRGFQIGFTAALVFGLTHLLLADHTGALDRRDWVGLIAGAAGLLCSGVGVTMTVVVGLAVLIRRSWRVALFHTVPLALVYIVWWRTAASDATAGDYATGQVTIDSMARFVATGLKATLQAMGQLPGVGAALALVLVLGLILEWRGGSHSEFRRRAATPGALLTGAVLFLGITARGRVAAFGPDFARSSRYLHVVAAMMLPAVALGADAVIRRWRLAAPAMLALLVVGIPSNMRVFADSERDQQHAQRDFKQLMLSLPRVTLAKGVPRAVRPETRLAGEVTVGWLLDGVSSGRIPRPGPITSSQAAADAFRLSIEQRRTGTRWNACQTLSKPITRRLDRGQSIGIRGSATWAPIRVTSFSAGLVGTVKQVFFPTDGKTLIAVAGPLIVQLTSVYPESPITVCDSPQSPF